MRRPRLIFPSFLILCTAALAAPTTAPTTQPHLDYVIIVTGGELLAGSYADAHTLFLTRTLRPLGLHCVGSMTVDDQRADILAAVRFARSRAKLTIVTGGLGPTDNDVTRQTLAQAAGMKLREDPQVLAEMERRFKTPRAQLRENLLRQTLVPQRGTFLKNPNGTAVGLIFELDDGAIVALPGPPRELQPMVRSELIPYLSARFGTRHPGASLTLRFVGLGQSQISQVLKEEVVLPPGFMETSTFEGGRVDFIFTAPTDSAHDRDTLDSIKRKLHARLGDNIYADDETSLEECIIKLLAARSATLAIAEVGSGGAVAAALNSAPGASAVIAGACTAPTERKLATMLRVNDQSAESLAAAASKAASSQWALLVGEIRQEGADRYLPVVFRTPDGRVQTRRIPLRGAGELARAGALTQILDQLRWMLGEIPR